jgi:adenosylhomocysteine nucleosidase
MPEETAGIVELLGNPVAHRIGGREYHVGRCHGIDTVVVFSRWGKVAASATAAVLFAHFGVDGILFVGVAGAVDPSLKLADIVVADDLLQHDMDASAIPLFRRFEVPLLGRARFSACEAWVVAAKSAASDFLADEFHTLIDRDTCRAFFLDNPKVVSGLIASGDRFIVDAGFTQGLQKLLPDLRCVEMEGAAVAQVCFEFDCPFAVIRIISDHADHDAPVDFERFVSRIAAVMSSRITDRFIRKLSESDLSHVGTPELIAMSVNAVAATSSLSAQDVIRILGLGPHPEGGHYRETFRDERADSGGRAVSTAILFLLAAGEVSAWHRVDASELWHYHAGAPLILTTTHDGREVETQCLGMDLMHGARPQIAIPAGQWQSASSLGKWTLVSCTVAPGFEFSKFELAPAGWKRAEAVLADVITKLQGTYTP